MYCNTINMNKSYNAVRVHFLPYVIVIGRQDNSTRLDGFLRTIISLELLICSLNMFQCLELLRVAVVDCYSTHDQGFSCWNSIFNKLATFTLTEGTSKNDYHKAFSGSLFLRLRWV